jgi:hypothetical protein
MSTDDPRLHLDAIREQSQYVEQLRYSIFQQVTSARRMGATWKQIGDALGTTKQAAQQRYGD